MTQPVRIIISGGGTGGHIYPAIAIANTLKNINPDTEVLFVGAEGKMEMQKVPQAGYKIVGLPIRGLQRGFDLSNFLLPWRFLNSLLKARKVIKEFRPQVAVGVGGYASGPLLYIAGLMKIPTLIQEQNSYAGITNKWLAKRASKICVAYEGMNAFFPAEKIVLTGNPVRKDILSADQKKSAAISHFQLWDNVPTLLIIGGSLGAGTINKSIQGAIETLKQTSVQVIWQTGKYYYEACQKAVAASGATNIRVFDFIGQMDLAYAAADVVISRAGALSISELCLAAKPSILVPSPNVAEDHQTKNAMALVKADAALLVKDTDAQQNLVTTALELLNNPERKEVLSQNIVKLGYPNAAEQIAKEILNLVH
ncbi:undecaprenyldiphospho-muramoylpentapeptide beta-N-acetylglucosaminyltransferase [Xanthocytophaga agilis]|uniref:UDP-N-acetylglucosamine--N-acetylmuramyl-(pentapeptide) pyrophosphoryl-undecaprenol N-acetylglucosamine transferase n=1 Tax=Xanthocytophaga agilis TaxID=3048010 RepID=A0AAE3UES0_9BACT|nr:undecaprenyldiphospho-muramoylpentapeptide beta-N-acetylglucosaminyltransferase [Xanthocytophaga agilis]MDJ1502530.1 undecaprenyldiphospho-muramoylpentapeptide beta-N-acetylglucosaminyltransferase [Xanthocytophaga agilis]